MPRQIEAQVGNEFRHAYPRLARILQPVWDRFIFELANEIERRGNLAANQLYEFVHQYLVQQGHQLYQDAQQQLGDLAYYINDGAEQMQQYIRHLIPNNEGILEYVGNELRNSWSNQPYGRREQDIDWFYESLNRQFAEQSLQNHPSPAQEPTAKRRRMDTPMEEPSTTTLRTTNTSTTNSTQPSKETPVTKTAPSYGIPNTHTTILPFDMYFTMYYSALTNGAAEIVIDMTRPFLPWVSPTLTHIDNTSSAAIGRS